MGELGIEALDGGDGDFDFIPDAGITEYVGIIELGEFSPIIGCIILLKLF